MKLVINRTDIINAFAAKTGLEPHQIEIDVVSEPMIPSFPIANSIHNPDVRMAIATIFDEASNIADNYREGNDTIPNKISLIKAVRALTHNTSLKDAKDYVENTLLHRH